jgi:hypothetical protein
VTVRRVASGVVRARRGLVAVAALSVAVVLVVVLTTSSGSPAHSGRLQTASAFCLTVKGHVAAIPSRQQRTRYLFLPTRRTCLVSTPQQPVALARAYFQAVAAKDVTWVCLLSTPHLQAIFRGDTGATTCQAAARILLHRVSYTRRGLAELRHASFRVLSQTSTRAIVERIGGRVKLILVRGSLGWLYDGREHQQVHRIED